MVKTPTAMQEFQETWVWSLGREDPLEKGMVTHRHSCLENSMDRGALWSIVHGVARTWTWLSNTHIMSLKFTGSWEGEMDVKQERERTSWNPWRLIRTHVSFHCFQSRWCGILQQKTNSLQVDNTHLDQEGKSWSRTQGRGRQSQSRRPPSKEVGCQTEC